MKSLFTVHAGEYLTGAYIEEKLSNKEHSYNVWVPGRDTGIDLLVTNSDNTKMCSLQVKYSKDYYLTLGGSELKFRICQNVMNTAGDVMLISPLQNIGKNFLKRKIKNNISNFYSYLDVSTKEDIIF